MTEPGPPSWDPSNVNQPPPQPPPPPPAYPNQPGYGAPPPAYGAPPAYGGGAPAATRPGQITAAAVIAFVMAAFQLFAAIGNFSLAATINQYTAAYWAFVSPGVLYALAVVNLVFAGLLIWGGLTTMQGKTNKILFFTAIAVMVVGVLTNIMVHNYAFAFLPVILPGIILFLLWQQPNKDWFVAQGGQTI